MSELLKGQLPASWLVAQMQDLVEINPARPTGDISDDDIVSFVPMAAVEELSGRLDPSRSRSWGEVKKGYTYFQEGDVLFAKITPCMENGKAALAFGLHGGRGTGSTEFHVLRAAPGINAKYVLNFVLQERYRREARLQMKGAAGQLRVPETFLATSQIPLAPSREQTRIVAEIEKQFTRLDAATASLQQVRARLDQYRASVLKAASEGRLVPTEAEIARAEERDYEPADKLIKHILADRRAKWEQQQIEKMRQDGVEPKNDRWRAKYREPSKPAELSATSTPEGWTNVTLGQLAWSVRDGPHFSPSYVDEGVPFITGGNVRPSGVDFDGAKRITPELHRQFSQRTKPEKGDILYTKGGTTGIARVNTYDIDFSVWVHVAVLKLAAGVDPFFLQHTLNSPSSYAQAQKFTHGVGNQDLGLTRMVNINFGLPPLAEQRRIAEEVDRRMSILDEVDHLVNASLLRGSRLRQAILSRAFEGHLVRQDANDESASILLNRIGAARARTATSEKGEAKRKRGRRKTMAQDRPVTRKTIIEVLTEAKAPLSPEKLFSATGNEPATIDEFYGELKAGVAGGQIEELRFGDAGVLLRLKQA